MYTLFPLLRAYLTVADLFLTRVGIGQLAVLMVSLMAALSVAAIAQAQDVREYFIDALVVVLLMAGVLVYCKDNKKGSPWDCV